jgi:hypothetical protein
LSVGTVVVVVLCSALLCSVTGFHVSRMLYEIHLFLLAHLVIDRRLIDVARRFQHSKFRVLFVLFSNILLFETVRIVTASCNRQFSHLH